MLSKMSAQQQGGGGGRRIPLSLTGTTGAGGGAMSSAAAGNNANTKLAHERKDHAAAASSSSAAGKDVKKTQNGVGNKNHGNAGVSEKDKERKQNGGEGNVNAAAAANTKIDKDKPEKPTKETTNSSKTEANCDRRFEKKVKIDMRRDVKIVAQKDEKKEEKFKERSEPLLQDHVKKAEAKNKKSEVVVIDVEEVSNAAKAPAAAPAAAAAVATQSTDKTKEMSHNMQQQVVGTPERRGRKPSNQKAATPTTSNRSAEPASQPQDVIVIDDTDLPMLCLDASPIKPAIEVAPPLPSFEPTKAAPLTPAVAAVAAAAAVVAKSVATAAANIPTATSTPGKIFGNKPKAVEPQLTNKQQPVTLGGSSPERKEYVPRNFSQISGRRSIRPFGENTPSKLQSNLPYRESYRRINTELDVTSNTNTSLDVTVGSEAPNNSSFSFSFFGRGRKRERATPPVADSNTQSTTELHTDYELSPPKRARLEKPGFLSGFMNSPMTALRCAFTRTNIATPLKSRLEETSPRDECDVQNVSGVVIEEEELAAEVQASSSQNDFNTDDFTNETTQDAPDKTAEEDVKAADELTPKGADKLNCSQEMSINDDSDILVTETLISDAKKHNRCSIM